MTAALGQTIKDATITKYFLSGPGSDLIPKTLLQMSRVPGFIKLFGPYHLENDQQRWADYNRFDWSIRQLPTINVFENQTESKDSDQAYLRGSIAIHVFWPPNFRRGDSRRVEASFKGAIENFFISDFVTPMLDEIYFNQRDCKVYGLNEFGKTLTWTPNLEGIIAEQAVPVTTVDVQYRIDLRAWYRALEYLGRTKADPFIASLDDLKTIGGIDGTFTSAYKGVDDNNVVQVEVPDEITVSNP